MTTTVHLLAFVTREACPMLRCWLRWFTRLLSLAPEAGRSSVEYSLQLQTYALPANNFTQRERWTHVLNARLTFVLRVLNALPRGAIVVFTDLDVVPFRPLSALLPLEHDLTFMREPPGHGGRTGRQIANAGFYAVRVSKAALRFFGHVRWLARKRPTLMDQDIVNWILLARPGTSMYHNVSWSTWPRALATGVVADITDQTAAFHSIFATSHDEKVLRLRKALRRHEAALGEAQLAGRTGGSAPELPACEPLSGSSSSGSGASSAPSSWADPIYCGGAAASARDLGSAGADSTRHPNGVSCHDSSHGRCCTVRHAEARQMCGVT